MIYAGVDIAKANHVIGAVGEDGQPPCKTMELKNSDAGFERCAAWLEGLAGGPSDVFIGMEATGHYWMALFARLASEGHSVCVINPMEVKAVRKLKGKSKVKNGRVDALLIAETLRIGEYAETKLASDEVQSLRTLTRYRQAIKEEAAQVKTQLTCVMDSYFPERAGVFSNMFGSASLAALEKSPMPSELLRRKSPSLAGDISRAARRPIGPEEASELKAAAKSSVGITPGVGAASFEVRSMVSQIRFLEERAAGVEGRVEEPLMGIEPLVLTIPGVSLATGAQIVAEIGDISRFRSAAALVSYAGLNSSVSQSGQFDSGGGPITKQGDPYLRRAVWLAANRARQHDPTPGAYYDKKRAEGKRHRVAVTAVARKLCHVIYAVMRGKVPYDPNR